MMRAIHSKDRGGGGGAVELEQDVEGLISMGRLPCPKTVSEQAKALTFFVALRQ